MMLPFILNMFALQIENLQEQLRDKEKQMSSLKERVKSLQADTSNTDTALTTLEESLAEKVSLPKCSLEVAHVCWLATFVKTTHGLYLLLGAHYRASKGAARQGRQGEDRGA